MKKFTLFFMSLFLAVGAMAQTFVMPETGKYYKIKGDNSQYPWLMGVQKSGGSGVAVSANESDAAIFEKTANGLKVYGTDTYLYYSGSSDVTIGNTESNVVIGDYNNSTDAGTKYTIKVAGAYMFNNNTDQQVHTSGAWDAVAERYWGFIEVNMGEQPALISRTGWGVTASSQETSGDPGQATNAIDGRNDTFWHTVYAETYPHWIEFDMTKAYTIYSFDYVSRFDNTNSNGNILEYKLYISNSAMNGNYENATLAASGTFEYGKGVNHLIELASPVAGRYVALVAESGTRGNWAGNAAANAANCAEFNVYGIEVPAETNEAAKAALGEAIAQAEALLATITIGDGVGEYSGSYTAAEIESVLGSMKNYYNAIDSNTAIADIEGCIDLIEEAIASYTLNMPVAGKYYTFKNDAYYITSGTTNDGKIALSQTNDAAAIYYYDGSHLLAYTTGRYIGLNATDWAFEAVGSNDISTIEFIAAANGALGKYNVKSGGRWLHRTDAYVNRCSSNPTNHPEHNWTIEEVESLPVSISAAGKATFFAPVAVAVPSGVTAHTVTINGDWATLNEITTGVIPANTGVVLEGAQNTYDFVITTTEATATSDLRGSAATTYYTEAGTYYALGIVDGVVAFYKDAFNNSRFQNNSHKAYLYVAGTNNTASYSFRYGEGTTGIDEMTEQRAESKEIYDLTGRRVENVTAPGIYIVNGKKVLVK